MQDNFRKSKELKVAIKAALKAGKIIEKYFETEILKEFKEDKSIVTLADKESEDVIKKIILKAFPEHSILGEETGMTGKKSEFVWHVDPVDGTRNFAHGIPIFAVSIALVCDDKVILGVVYNPASRSLFYAELGKGAYMNDKRIFVSKDGREHSMMTISPSRKENDKNLMRELFYSLPKIVGPTRNLGSTAIELAYVSRGGLEANIQLGLETYDFAAGTLLIQEAGGNARGKQKKEEKTLKDKYKIALLFFKDKFKNDITDPNLLKILNETDILIVEEMRILFDKNTSKETKIRIIEKIQNRMFGLVPTKVGMDPDNPFPEVPQTIILQVQPFPKDKTKQNDKV